MRLVINTGKGGVGKTSVSAATAKRAADMGYRTLVMSTDSAHSLADSFDIKLGHDITNIGKNLDALEIDIIHEMRTKWGEIQKYVTAFMESQGVRDITAEEMAVIPGMEMIAALFYILDFEENDKYDFVVMDTAPTGETLRLLSFPDISQWYLDKLLNLAKKIVSMFGNTVSKVVSIPIPGKEVFDSIIEIKDKMFRVKKLLEDPSKTTVRLIVNPEKMVINETMRAYSYLCLYNKTVECLICNKVLPYDIETDYFKDKLEEQKKYIEMIHNAFDPMKMLFSYQMPTEMVGKQMLNKLADMIYGENDPTEIYANESPMRFIREDDMDVLEIKMPFVEKSDVELMKINNDTLMIIVGSQKRTVNLPLTIAKKELIGAELKEQKLRIKFKGDSNGEEDE